MTQNDQNNPTLNAETAAIHVAGAWEKVQEEQRALAKAFRAMAEAATKQATDLEAGYAPRTSVSGDLMVDSDHAERINRDLQKAIEVWRSVRYAYYAIGITTPDASQVKGGAK